MHPRSTKRTADVKEDWKILLQNARNLSHKNRRKQIKQAKRRRKRCSMAILACIDHKEDDDSKESENEDQETVSIDCGDYFSVGLCLEYIKQNFVTEESPKRKCLNRESCFLETTIKPDDVVGTVLESEPHPVIASISEDGQEIFSASKTVSTAIPSLSDKQICDGGKASPKRSAEKETEIENLLNTLDAEVKDWHNPYLEIPAPTPVFIDSTVTNYTEQKCEVDRLKNKSRCPFYDAVGCCRYGDKCSRRHKEYKCTTTILMEGMFKTFAFDMTRRAIKSGGIKGDDYGIGLEHTDEDLYENFEEFSKDVLHELDKFGRILQFKVCCNRTDHLQGNVYVEYEKKRYAKRAYKALHLRFYDGKRVQCKFVKIKSWKHAICGMHYRRGHCTHGDRCSFLHVFKDKRGKFYKADNDYYR